MQRRGYSDQTTDQAIERLRALDYVDDQSFAENWARSKVESRGYGPKRIEQELRSKGIEPKLILEVISEIFGRGEELERAKAALAKRFKGSALNEPKTLRRAAAFLQRRGFNGQVIFDLLRYSDQEA